MSLLDTARKGVATANKVTRPFQPLVQYRRNTGVDDYGNKTYTPPITDPALELHAIVEYKSRMVRTPNGIMTVSRAIIMLVDIVEVVAATAGNGIGNDDLFILPDGDTGPILDLGGFVDAGTTHPIATEVMLG